MRQVLLIAIMLGIVSCGSLARPDLGSKKVAGTRYIAEQPTLLGKPVGEPRWVPLPSKKEKLVNQLQAPAEWTLKIALPLGLLSFAVMLMIGSPGVMKIAGTAAAVFGVMSVGATAWLMATTWLLLLIPLVVVALVLGYLATRGKSLRSVFRV